MFIGTKIARTEEGSHRHSLRTKHTFTAVILPVPPDMYFPIRGENKCFQHSYPDLTGVNIHRKLHVS